MSAERVRWRVAEAAENAQLIGARGVHGYWPLLAPSFRRVLLPPIRHAEGAELVWEWLAPRAAVPPGEQDLAGLRASLEDAEAAFTADFEQRLRDSAGAGADSLLEGVRRLSGRLRQASDADLAVRAVLTEQGWRLRSWGFPQASPASIAGDEAAPRAADPQGGALRAEPAPRRRRRRLLWFLLALVLTALGTFSARSWLGRVPKGATEPETAARPAEDAAPDTPETTPPTPPPATLATLRPDPPNEPREPLPHPPPRSRSTPAQPVTNGTRSGDPRALRDAGDFGADRSAPEGAGVPSALVGRMPSMLGAQVAPGGAPSELTAPTEALPPDGGPPPAPPPGSPPELQGGDSPPPPAPTAPGDNSSHDASPGSTGRGTSSGPDSKPPGDLAGAGGNYHFDPGPPPPPARAALNQAAETPELAELGAADRVRRPAPPEETGTKSKKPPAEKDPSTSTPPPEAGRPAQKAAAPPTPPAADEVSAPTLSDPSPPGSRRLYFVGRQLPWQARLARDEVLPTGPVAGDAGDALRSARAAAWSRAQARLPASLRQAELRSGWAFRVDPGIEDTPSPRWTGTQAGALLPHPDGSLDAWLEIDADEKRVMDARLLGPDGEVWVRVSRAGPDGEVRIEIGPAIRSAEPWCALRAASDQTDTGLLPTPGWRLVRRGDWWFSQGPKERRPGWTHPESGWELIGGWRQTGP